MGNVELFELCETSPKVQCSECLLCWNQGKSIALVDISWKKVKPAKMFNNGDWMLSQPRTTSSRRDDLEVLGTARTEEHKENFIAHNARKRCLKKKFERIHDRFLKDSTYCDSQEMHQWDSDQTSEKHLQICTVSTVNLEKIDLNQFLLINTKGGIRRLLHPVPHGGSLINYRLSMNDLWAHAKSSLKEQGDLFWMLTHQETQSDIFDDFSVVRSFTADSNLLQPTGCVNRTPSHVTFSRFSQHISMSHVTLAQGVLRARHPCIIRMVSLSWYSSTLHSALFTVSLICLFILLIFIFIFHVGWFGEKFTVRFREWGVRHSGRQQPSHISSHTSANRLPVSQRHCTQDSAVWKNFRKVWRSLCCSCQRWDTAITFWTRWSLSSRGESRHILPRFLSSVSTNLRFLCTCERPAGR